MYFLMKANLKRNLPLAQVHLPVLSIILTKNILEFLENNDSYVVTFLDKHNIETL